MGGGGCGDGEAAVTTAGGGRIGADEGAEEAGEATTAGKGRGRGGRLDRGEFGLGGVGWRE
jgi:hypothetical protein